MSTVEAVLYGTHVCNSQRPMRVRVVRVAKLAISFLGITLCVCVCVLVVFTQFNVLSLLGPVMLQKSTADDQ